MWLTSVKILIKQDVIIIWATIKPPKLSMALVGLTFTRNGLGMGVSMVFNNYLCTSGLRG
jgi:hypothetical protein